MLIEVWEIGFFTNIPSGWKRQSVWLLGSHCSSVIRNHKMLLWRESGIWLQGQSGTEIHWKMLASKCIMYIPSAYL